MLAVAALESPPANTVPMSLFDSGPAGAASAGAGASASASASATPDPRRGHIISFPASVMPGMPNLDTNSVLRYACVEQVFAGAPVHQFGGVQGFAQLCALNQHGGDGRHFCLENHTVQQLQEEASEALATGLLPEMPAGVAPSLLPGALVLDFMGSLQRLFPDYATRLQVIKVYGPDNGMGG